MLETHITSFYKQKLHKQKHLEKLFQNGNSEKIKSSKAVTEAIPHCALS